LNDINDVIASYQKEIGLHLINQLKQLRIN